MKKPQREGGYPVAAYLRQLPMLMLFILASLGAFAQDSGSREQSGNDPVQDYMNANKETSLVRFYLAYPEDGDAARAVKYAMITENPGMFPEFTEVDLQRMHSALKGFNEKVIFVNEQIAKGATPDLARDRYNRHMMTQQQDPENRNADSGTEPILSVPSGQ